MSFKFPCPHCGQRIGATLEDVGTLGGCPRCQRQFVVPEPPEAVPEAVPEAAPEAAPEAVTESPAEPDVPPTTHRGMAILALLLSIFPVLNLPALALAIYAIIRSERSGRHGERGLAIAAVVVTSVLLVPVNLAGTVAGYTAVYLKPAAMNSTPRTVSPAPTPAKPVKH